MKKEILKQIYETVIAYEETNKDVLTEKQLGQLEIQKKELLKGIKYFWYRGGIF